MAKKLFGYDRNALLLGFIAVVALAILVLLLQIRVDLEGAVVAPTVYAEGAIVDIQGPYADQFMAIPPGSYNMVVASDGWFIISGPQPTEGMQSELFGPGGDQLRGLGAGEYTYTAYSNGNFAVTGPQPTGPQPTGPQPTGPQPTGPQPTGPQPTG